MSQKSVKELTEEILDMLDKYRERDMTYAEAIGCLEFAKMAVHSEAMEDEPTAHQYKETTG